MATVTVSSTHLQDATGTPVANATVYFAPVDALGYPYAHANGGATTGSPVSTTVTAGAFSISLITGATYKVTLIDNVSGKSLPMPGYLITPTGTTWNLDTFSPNLGVSLNSATASLPGQELGVGDVESVSVAIANATPGCGLVVSSTADLTIAAERSLKSYTELSGGIVCWDTADIPGGGSPIPTVLLTNVSGTATTTARCSTAGSVIVERRINTSQKPTAQLIQNNSFEVAATSPQVFSNWAYTPQVSYDSTTSGSAFFDLSSVAGATSGTTALRFISETATYGQYNGAGWGASYVQTSTSFPVTIGDTFRSTASVEVTNPFATDTVGFPMASLCGCLLVTYSDGSTQTSLGVLQQATTSGFVNAQTFLTVPASASGTANAVSAVFQLWALGGHDPAAPGAEWFTPVTINAGQVVLTVDSVTLSASSCFTTSPTAINVTVLS